MNKYTRLIVSGLITVLAILIKPILDHFFSNASGFSRELLDLVYQQRQIIVILAFSWTLIELIKFLKKLLLKQYDITEEDNLHSRKVHTQVNILQKILVFTIILFAVGMVLLSFDGIRKIGISLFASAGLAGIIIGLSAQKVVGTLLAGIQIAFTQPFRIDDAVVVENEWGWIEEINLTYVVVRIWDKRRLVLPSTYFLEKPFQNWTRTSADIIGTVFIYTDYNISFQALRDELTKQLAQTDLWDGNVQVLQVTEAKESNVEIRILVSAKNSPSAWDLRVLIREKMIEFIQQNYPESLPKTRVLLHQNQANEPLGMK